MRADLIMRQKAALRQTFRAYRSSLAAEEYAARSAAIAARLRRLPELAEATTIHGFWPMLARREVDLRALYDELRAEGKQIVLPVVVTFSAAPGPAPRLRHVRYEGADALCPNRWGIAEPTGPDVPLDAIDVVVVPALGAGRNGHRIGHGFGYYDELLGALACPALCPVYEGCLVEAVPAEPHDVAMTALVTETDVIRPVPA